MSKLKITLTVSCLIALMGCGEAKTPSTPETSSPSVTTNLPIEKSSPGESPTTASINTPQTAKSSPNRSQSNAVAKAETPGQNQLILAQGIGEAKVGMTLGELKKALAGKAEFQVKSPFIVDFDAIAIVQSKQEQYYILYPAGSPLGDSDILEALVTNNPSYRTAQGVGPGTPLQQAEAAYGDATLSYNLVNESREYVKFAKHPAETIRFRLGAANDGSLSGIYPSSSGEYNETKDYKKTATIGFVEVYCGQNCPLPSPN